MICIITFFNFYISQMELSYNSHQKPALKCSIKEAKHFEITSDIWIFGLTFLVVISFRFATDFNFSWSHDSLIYYVYL